MNRSTKKGSVIVEAAIVLPIFIIAVLTVGYTVKCIHASESVMHVLSDEARLIQTYAYDIKIGAAYPLKLTAREKKLDIIDDFDVEDFDYLFDEGLISIDSRYVVNNKLPILFHDHFKKKESVLFRGFVPHDNSGEIYSFDKMQMEDDGTIVWVFPHEGERFHKENCSYIEVEPMQRVLTKEIRDDYAPCSHCKPDEFGNGHLIYVFKTGSVYHDGKCSMVERYVIPMTRGMAIDKGYTPCMKCGG